MNNIYYIFGIFNSVMGLLQEQWHSQVSSNNLPGEDNHKKLYYKLSTTCNPVVSTFYMMAPPSPQLRKYFIAPLPP